VVHSHLFSSARVSNQEDEHDQFLLVTFISETRLLAINDNDELEETGELPG
jgi:hypothetical protein